MLTSAIPRSALSSPPSIPSVVSSPSRTTSPGSRTSPRSNFNFEIEQGSPQRPNLRRGASSSTTSSYVQETQALLAANVAKIVETKAHPFAISGRIPVDAADLTLFFRTKSGITHSLDFPFDVDYDTPPALDVLLAASQPYPTLSGDDSLTETEALYYPPHLPLTTSLEIANHPILDAIRTTLFPALPTGHYLTALRDCLHLVPAGARIPPQGPPADGRVATLAVTLPVRHRGGALIVHSADGAQDVFPGRGGRAGHIDWVAYFSDAEHETERVSKGCKVLITYAVQLRTFGPAGDPLITPSDEFLDAIAPVLNIMRGRVIAFHLGGDYGVSPAEVLADSLVPYLKGGDSMLYHALKLYKLSPELRWSAGPYIWPVDGVVEIGDELESNSPYSPTPIYAYGDLPPDDAFASIANRVEASGAMTIAEADIVVLTDKLDLGPTSKERVPIVSGGVLDKLVVNILLVVYVP